MDGGEDAESSNVRKRNTVGPNQNNSPIRLKTVGNATPRKAKPESVYNIGNVIWLLVSIGVFYLTDFAVVLLYDERILQSWLICGGAFCLLATVCCMYCVIWLSWIKGMSSDLWEKHNPYIIPVATVAMLIGVFSVTRSVWPVWNILTIPIVVSQIMGFVVFIAMIPGII